VPIVLVCSNKPHASSARVRPANWMLGMKEHLQQGKWL
jgi:hypothetical protein